MKKFVIAGKEVINNEIRLSDGCVMLLKGDDTIKDIADHIQAYEFFVERPMSWSREDGFYKE